MNQDFTNQQYPGNPNNPNLGQMGPDPNQQQNAWQQPGPGAGPGPQQGPGAGPQAGPGMGPQQEQSMNESLANRIRASWEKYQQAKKVAEEFQDNEELKRVVEETAYQQFKENVQGNVNSFFKSMGKQNQAKSQFNFGGTGTWQPHKLHRSEKEKIIAGVCGGISEYFNVDVTVVRVLFVIGTVFYFLGLIAYIVLAILLPVKNEMGA